MGWGDPGHDDFPEDWQSLELNMPAAANTTCHNLPPIYGDGPLDEATPDAVAFLLAIATQNQGARSMLLKEDGSAAIFNDGKMS
jgi:hypothetical protein